MNEVHDPPIAQIERIVERTRLAAILIDRFQRLAESNFSGTI